MKRKDYMSENEFFENSIFSSIFSKENDPSYEKNRQRMFRQAKRFLKSGNTYKKTHALAWIGQAKYEKGKPCLVKALRSKSAEIRRAAIQGLGDMCGNPEALHYAIKGLRDKDATARDTAYKVIIRILGSADPGEIVAHPEYGVLTGIMEKALVEKDNTDRIRASAVLSKLGFESGKEELKKILSGNNRSDKIWLLFDIRNLGYYEKDLYPILLRICTEPEECDSEDAKHILKTREKKRALADIKKFIKEKKTKDLSHAIEFLAYIMGRKAVPELKRLLKEKDPRASLPAANVLMKYSKKESIHKIVDIAYSGSGGLKNRAMKELLSEVVYECSRRINDCRQEKDQNLKNKRFKEISDLASRQLSFYNLLDCQFSLFRDNIENEDLEIRKDSLHSLGNFKSSQALSTHHVNAEEFGAKIGKMMNRGKDIRWRALRVLESVGGFEFTEVLKKLKRAETDKEAKKEITREIKLTRSYNANTRLVRRSFWRGVKRGWEMR